MMQNNYFKILKSNLALVVTALIVGLIVSLVAQFFSLIAKKVFDLIQSNNFFSLLFLDNYELNFFPLIACLIAGILIGVIIKFFKIERWQGPADTIYAVHQKAGLLDVKKGFLSTIAAFFSISGGASVGIYGPLVHFGGTLAAFLRRITFIPNIPHNVIIGAGVAAAISAGFGSPIAGIIFAHEVILRYFSIRALTAISLASVSASFLAQSLNIVEPDLRFVVFSFELVNSIPGLIIVGLTSALAAYIFMNLLLLSTKFANSIKKIPLHYKPLFPALLCGSFGIFFPEVIGLGSETIKSVITESHTLSFLLLVLIFKIILTSICIGFGMFGGVLSPALLIGCSIGALVFHIPYIGIDQNLSQILAVSGMAAVASSVIGGPITAVILVLELTGSYQYALASIFAIAISNLITYFIFGSSFFDKQLKLRQINIGFGREFILMNTTNIGDFVEKKFLKFDKECSIEEALKGFKKFDCTEGYFVDNQNQFLGKLKLIDILGKKSEMSLKYKEKSFLKLKPDNNINETINILGSFVGESVPVIDNKNVLIGIISENNVLQIYRNITSEIRSIEKN